LRAVNEPFSALDRNSGEGERWLAFGIECYDLPIKHRIVRHSFKSFDDGSVSRTEIVIVPRSKLDFATFFECDGTVSIQLYFIGPSLPSGSLSVRSKSMGSMKEGFTLCRTALQFTAGVLPRWLAFLDCIR
jgi:hypothetical protein